MDEGDLVKLKKAKDILDAADAPTKGRILWDGERFIDLDTMEPVLEEE